jgi:hypothetical protein
MTVYEKPESEIAWVGRSVPFAGERGRDLLLAAALGRPSGFGPVDLALLSAASRRGPAALQAARLFPLDEAGLASPGFAASGRMRRS